MATIHKISGTAVHNGVIIMSAMPNGNHTRGTSRVRAQSRGDAEQVLTDVPTTLFDTRFDDPRYYTGDAAT